MVRFNLNYKLNYKLEINFYCSVHFIVEIAK